MNIGRLNMNFRKYKDDALIFVFEIQLFSKPNPKCVKCEYRHKITMTCLEFQDKIKQFDCEHSDFLDDDENREYNPSQQSFRTVRESP
jgi:hypothetical protein